MLSIKALCLKIGSQCEAARQVGVSDRTVRRWVKANKCPSGIRDQLVHMAEIISGKRKAAR